MMPLPFLNFITMAKNAKINEPTLEQQRELNRVVINSVDKVKVRDTEYSVRWLRGYTQQRITDIMLKEPMKDELGQDITSSKDACKCAALIILDRLWRIKLFYWIVWRWFYYVKEYGEHELFPIFEKAQKKMACQNVEFQFTTTFLTALKNTKMMMTREEVKATQAAHTTATNGK
jgi:hypothetical protein